jgi:hypothetical protein
MASDLKHTILRARHSEQSARFLAEMPPRVLTSEGERIAACASYLPARRARTSIQCRRYVESRRNVGSPISHKSATSRPRAGWYCYDQHVQRESTYGRSHCRANSSPPTTYHSTG